VPPDLAQHCKSAQAAQPGYLARLIEKDLKESNMIKQSDFDVVQENGNFYPRALDSDHEIDAYGTFQTEAEALAFIENWVDQSNREAE
jgi:hypothetical protein